MPYSLFMSGLLAISAFIVKCETGAHKKNGNRIHDTVPALDGHCRP